MATIRLRRYTDPNGEPPFEQETLMTVEGKGRDEFPEDDGGVGYYNYLRGLCLVNGYQFKSYSGSIEDSVDQDVTVFGHESESERQLSSLMSIMIC